MGPPKTLSKSVKIYASDEKMIGPKNLFAGWLGDVSPDFSAELLKRGEWMEMQTGSILYSIGEDQSSLWGLASGMVRMHVSMNEHEGRLGHIVGPGFWFGEYELVAGGPRIMEMEAAEDPVLLRVRPDVLKDILARSPENWRWLTLLAVQHQAVAITAADDLMLRSAVKRLAALLLRLSGRRAAHPSSMPLDTIPATQQEVALAANMSRATAGEILRDFEAAGLISRDYRAIHIHQARGLSGLLSKD
ncbi:MAG: Crp/Fnr family transcriptional regulator [Methyloceanibacter sp.]|jgi:CRP/FNR family cyclic AMP-dependent transcriptional regulator